MILPVSHCIHPLICSNQFASDSVCIWLFQIPLEIEIRKGGDEGIPIVISAPDSVVSGAYGDLAQNIINRLEELSKEQPLPEILLWSCVVDIRN